jgi:photosystem II stability/assembly factor-like uncharacterized protein
MKSKKERGGRKRKPLPGGKALHRMRAFLAARDVTLADEIVGTAAAKTRAPDRGSRRSKALADLIANAAEAYAKTQPVGRKNIPRVARAALATQPIAPASQWNCIGPADIPNGQTYGTNTIAVSGRVAAIAVDPSNAAHVLVGAAGGGIWESIDTGANWICRGDQLPCLSIGAIAFDHTNPRNVYAGSGEGNAEYAVLGAGVFKSIDGGTTWNPLARTTFAGIGFYDLLVDPADPTVIYAATTVGFFMSSDSGATWTSKRGGGNCWDLSLDPSGGPSAELLLAFFDGVFSWTRASGKFRRVRLPGNASGKWARLAIDRVVSAPDVAYVFGCSGTTPYLWRRAGGVWSKIMSLPKVDPKNPWTNQAWYDWHVAATPDNPRQVYLGGIDLYRGDFNGSSWKFTDISTQGQHSVHPDQHCLTFSPNDSKVIYAGSDGGIFRSTDSGRTWHSLNPGLAISEVQYLAGDPNSSTWLMAGLQDNGTIRYDGSLQWKQIAQGDGGDCGVNPLDPTEVYHSFYYDPQDGLGFQSSRDKGETWRDLNPPNVPMNFYPPVEVFGQTVAIGAQALLVSRDRGTTWSKVPLGLAARDTALPTAMREIDANTILIGNGEGRLLRVTWNGAIWQKTTLASPADRAMSCIAVDPSNAQRYWITFSEVGGPTIFRSDDAGVSWVDCSAGLPAAARRLPLHSVVVDPGNYQRVWTAADVGVYQTIDGSTWSIFGQGLPNAMAVDLLLHKQDRVLFCATRNRGVWAIAV